MSDNSFRPPPRESHYHPPPHSHGQPSPYSGGAGNGENGPNAYPGHRGPPPPGQPGSYQASNDYRGGPPQHYPQASHYPGHPQGGYFPPARSYPSGRPSGMPQRHMQYPGSEYGGPGGYPGAQHHGHHHQHGYPGPQHNSAYHPPHSHTPPQQTTPPSHPLPPRPTSKVTITDPNTGEVLSTQKLKNSPMSTPGSMPTHPSLPAAEIPPVPANSVAKHVDPVPNGDIRGSGDAEKSQNGVNGTNTDSPSEGKGVPMTPTPERSMSPPAAIGDENPPAFVAPKPRSTPPPVAPAAVVTKQEPKPETKPTEAEPVAEPVAKPATPTSPTAVSPVCAEDAPAPAAATAAAEKPDTAEKPDAAEDAKAEEPATEAAKPKSPAPAIPLVGSEAEADQTPPMSEPVQEQEAEAEPVPDAAPELEEDEDTQIEKRRYSFKIMMALRDQKGELSAESKEFAEFLWNKTGMPSPWGTEPPTAEATAVDRTDAFGFGSNVVTTTPGFRSPFFNQERDIHHKVMSVLSRVTPQRYDALKDELLQLPLRQTTDQQLKNVVDVIFDKAIKEPEFNLLYAKLVKDVYDAPTSKVLVQGSGDESSQQTLSNRLRRALLNKCQVQFEHGQQKEELEATCGGPEEKEALLSKMKKRLTNNVKFLGELYKMKLVTDRLVGTVLFGLIFGKSSSDYIPPPYEVEEAATLLQTMGTQLYNTVVGKEILPPIEDRIRQLGKTYTENRIRFKLMNLCDLIDAKYVSKKNDGPMSFDELGRKKYNEQLDIQSSLEDQIRKNDSGTGSFGSGVSTPTTPVEPRGMPLARPRSQMQNQTFPNSALRRQAPSPLTPQQLPATPTHRQPTMQTPTSRHPPTPTQRQPPTPTRGSPIKPSSPVTPLTPSTPSADKLTAAMSSVMVTMVTTKNTAPAIEFFRALPTNESKKKLFFAWVKRLVSTARLNNDRDMFGNLCEALEQNNVLQGKDMQQALLAWTKSIVDSGEYDEIPRVWKNWTQVVVRAERTFDTPLIFKHVLGLLLYNDAAQAPKYLKDAYSVGGLTFFTLGTNHGTWAHDRFRVLPPLLGDSADQVMASLITATSPTKETDADMFSDVAADVEIKMFEFLKGGQYGALETFIDTFVTNVVAGSKARGVRATNAMLSCIAMKVTCAAFCYVRRSPEVRQGLVDMKYGPMLDTIRRRIVSPDPSDPPVGFLAALEAFYTYVELSRANGAALKKFYMYLKEFMPEFAPDRFAKGAPHKLYTHLRDTLYKPNIVHDKEDALFSPLK